jgi:hypothetical protein
MLLPGLNKYTALVIVLIILLVCYFGYGMYDKKKEKVTGKGKKGGKGKGGKSSKNIKSGKSRVKKASSSSDDDDEDGDDGEVSSDAEELFNLVHEGLCNGMQNDEFREIVGSLADDFVFIELKQLYSEATRKKMDCREAVTLEDYANVLARVDG